MSRLLMLLFVCLLSSEATAKTSFCERPIDCGPEGVCLAGVCQTGNARAGVEILYALAVPPLLVVEDKPWLRAAAARLHAQLKRDLNGSGFYVLVDRADFPESWKREGLSGAGMNRPAWQRAGLYRVLRLALRATGNGHDYEITVRLLQVEEFATSSFPLTKLIVRPGMTRAAAARLANSLVGYDTGLPGVAGTRIAMSVQLGRGHKEIGTVEADGQVFRIVTATGGLNLDPAWAPDGRLGYMSYRGRIAAWMSDGHVLSGRPGMNASGAWSPDGRWLALSVTDKGNSDIVIIDGVTGREKQRVTAHKRADTSPTWSPDGRRLAFVTDRRGMPQIWIADLEKGTSRPLTRTGYHSSPAWSPNGHTLVYTQMKGSNFVIKRHDLDTGQVRTLTRSTVSSENPSFSPYGRYIVFARRVRQSQASHLWMMDASGARLRPMSTAVLPMYAPAWHRKPVARHPR